MRVQRIARRQETVPALVQRRGVGEAVATEKQQPLCASRPGTQ